MQVIPERFKLDFKPVAHCDAVVRLGNARFTVLTDRLIRLEYHPENLFEDRASQTFWFREQPVPEFMTHATAKTVEIETACLKLRYLENGDRGFSRDNLSITLKESGVVWHPGDKAEDNLLGTTRTLDFINGYAPLNPGLISRAGWSVVDDSATLVFNEECWIEPRVYGGIDWYFLGYGHDYKACLHDYCQISGQVPLIPRWILGNWWSRYWAYTQDEFTHLISDFEAHKLPFSVCIIDMDWHITKTGNGSSGWTGYTWNRELFHDPEGFIEFLHQKGLKTALNLHPAEGIHPHEAQYAEMARRVGIDPASKQPVQFNIDNPAFAEAYFEVLHHPYEAMGIDFWWVDWQQGLTCDLPGLDPLWLINHLHFYDLGRNGERRPFVFSRWGNEGHQRYPIGFSGDTYRTWDSLRFQSYMTATAANVAYGWWSHDIGGHASGEGDGELFTRWVQFGVFSPIMRIHVGKGHFYDVRPWLFENNETRRVLREALQLRHALIPYLYTMAQRAHRESLPLMQPMYYDYPEEEAAYHCPHQYLFGTELIAAPFVTPADPDTRLSRQVVWLPEGDWTHFFTGEYFPGNRWYAVYGEAGDIPVFARAGAIVPLGPHVQWGGVENPDELHLHIFAGAEHTFTLYEDDGESMAYEQEQHCQTTFTQKWSGNRLEFSIEAPAGDTRVMPSERAYHLHVHGVQQAVEVIVEVDGRPVAIDCSYDEKTETLHLSPVHLDATSTLRLILQGQDDSLLARRKRKRETTLHMLGVFKLHTGVRNSMADQLDAIVADPAQLAPYIITLAESQGRALFETLCEAGLHVVHDTQKPTLVVMWNNTANQQISFRYRDVYLNFGVFHTPHYANGVVPRFATFAPPSKMWRHGGQGEHIHRSQWQAQIDYLNLMTVAEGHIEKTP